MAKRQKIKRSHLKMYSSAKVNTGSRYNGSLGALMRQKLRVDEDAFMQSLNLTRANPNAPLVEVLRRIVEEKNSDTTHRHIRLHNGRLRKVFMFYSTNRDYAYAYLMEIDYTLMQMRTSIRYPDNSRAMYAQRIQKVVWKDWEHIPDTVLAKVHPSPFPSQ